MLKLKKIAVTGGIATGKSTACRFFQEFGAYVVDSDALSHELLDSKTSLGQQIIWLAGHEIVENGIINRKALAEKVFKDQSLLTKLEHLLHPKIWERIKTLYRYACQQPQFTSYVVEMPLLYETNTENFFDVVIAMTSPSSVAQKRFESKGFSQQTYTLRMKRQLCAEQKARRADYTVQNNGSLEDLKRQIQQLNQMIHHNP